MMRLYGVTSLRGLTEKIKDSTPSIKYKNEQTRAAAKKRQEEFTQDWGEKQSVGRRQETSKLSQRQVILYFSINTSLRNWKEHYKKPRPQVRFLDQHLQENLRMRSKRQDKDERRLNKEEPKSLRIQKRYTNTQEMIMMMIYSCRNYGPL